MKTIYNDRSVQQRGDVPRGGRGDPAAHLRPRPQRRHLLRVQDHQGERCAVALKGYMTS